MNVLSIIALCLIFLGGCGAILLSIGQANSSANDKLEIINTTKSENELLKNELKEIKKERDALNNILEQRDHRIKEQNNNIIYLSTKYMTKIYKYLYHLERKRLKEQLQYKLVHV